MIKEPLTQEDIKKTAQNRCNKRYSYLHNNAFFDGFIDGAEWRINSVWHDCNDRSVSINNKNEVVLLLENGKIVEYEDNWEEYYSLVLKWAYKKDLLPNKED